MNENDELPEDEEEILVYVEFDGSVASNSLSNEKLQLDMIGLDREHPIMQVNGKFYEGTYQDAIGTYMFFEGDDNPLVDDPVFDVTPTLKYFGKTRKILKMNRIFVELKTEMLGDSKDPECIPSMEMIEKLGIPPRYQEGALRSWEKMRDDRMRALNDYLEKQRLRDEKRSQGIEPDSASDDDNPFAIYKPEAKHKKTKQSETRTHIFPLERQNLANDAEIDDKTSTMNDGDEEIDEPTIEPDSSVSTILNPEKSAFKDVGTLSDPESSTLKHSAFIDPVSSTIKNSSTVIDPGPSTSKNSKPWTSPSNEKLEDNFSTSDSNDDTYRINLPNVRTMHRATVQVTRRAKIRKYGKFVNKRFRRKAESSTRSSDEEILYPEKPNLLVSSEIDEDVQPREESSKSEENERIIEEPTTTMTLESMEYLSISQSNEELTKNTDSDAPDNNEEVESTMDKRKLEKQQKRDDKTRHIAEKLKKAADERRLKSQQCPDDAV